MKRVFLKLSGEALAGEKHTGFDEPTVTEVAKQVKQERQEINRFSWVRSSLRSASSFRWRKLERTQENLVRITDKIDELELQVEPLRAQSEKARKFLVLRDELRGLEISLWLEQLEKIRAGAIKTLSDYENAVRQKEEAQGAA